jgi:hypothetical protein
MMDKNLDYLLDEYTDRINMLQKAVSAGNCANYEEYKYACGQIRGLEAACLTITDLKKRLENSDE